MKLRELPGALALGLLASILAHAVSFGNSHVMGGAHHELLDASALLGAAGFAVLVAALAWTRSAVIADGSILAARLSGSLPGLFPLAGAATGWFALTEALEPAHQTGSIAAILLGLALSVWLIRALAQAALRILASIAVAIRRGGFAPRLPRWSCTAPCLIPVASSLHRHRRFARPPPSVLFS